MNKTVGIVLLIVGLVVLGYGIAANDSVSSDVSRLFTGAPTNKTLALVILGAILSIMGARSAFGKE